MGEFLKQGVGKILFGLKHFSKGSIRVKIASILV
jgi:hypothetical protein